MISTALNFILSFNFMTKITFLSHTDFGNMKLLIMSHNLLPFTALHNKRICVVHVLAESC